MTEFFVILSHFLPFDPPNNLKNQSFNKMKHMPEEIIILHLRTTNDDHMMYGPEIWSVTDRIFSHFEPFFVLYNLEN